MKKKVSILVTCLLLVLSLTVTIVTGITYSKFKNYEVEFKLQEGTIVEKFSKYSPSLKGTIGDSNIYIIDSGVPGASILVIGGTHPNEPAGQIAATLFLENVKVTQGKVFVITECNKSAYGYSYPLEASPMYYNIQTQTGERLFKFGTRATNNTEQWPNPDVYVHAQSGQKLSASETRNLNRSYPGRIDGTYSERVAFAVAECIRQNDITLTVDLHEASPEYVTINAIIFHERASSIASRVQMAFEAIDLAISPEPSPANLHGLTHRELGDYTDTLAFIMETSNASQGKIRGAFTESIIVDGTTDKFYSRIQALDEERGTKILYADVTSIDERVARHVYGIQTIISSYNKDYSKDKLITRRDGTTFKEVGKLIIEGLPDYDEMIQNGIGKYL